MKQRTAWLVTGTAGTSVVLAFYAVFNSHVGGELVSIVAPRTPTPSGQATFGQNWQAGRGVILDASVPARSRVPVLAGRKANLGRPEARRAIPDNRDRKATADHQDRRVSRDLQVRRERQGSKVRRVSRGLKG